MTAVLAMTAAMLLLSGCGDTEDTVAAATSSSTASPASSSTAVTPTLSAQDAADRAYAIRVLKKTRELADEIHPYATYAGVLPNHVYRTTSGATSTVSDAVVVGRVIDLVDDNREHGVTVHLVVVVDESLGHDVGDTVAAGLGLAPSVDLDRFERGVEALGRVVVPVSDEAVRFREVDGVRGVLENGELIAVVAADGTLSLPVAFGSRAETMLADTPTLDALRQAARAPRVVETVSS